MRFVRWLRVANARAKKQGREVRARQEAERAASEAAGLPAAERVRRPSRHPKGRIIAFIWIGLFVLGFIGAAVFHDNNPSTDDAAGWGALIGAGIALTAVYVIGSIVCNGLSSLVNPRKPH